MNRKVKTSVIIVLALACGVLEFLYPQWRAFAQAQGYQGYGPITTNVVADPNPIAVTYQGNVTANVDDSTTGGLNIHSAEYCLDSVCFPMEAEDGSFDEVSENVRAVFNAPSAVGVYDLCVRGTDADGNIGELACILLVVYDPDGGFVTGGGWIDSPAGAFKQNIWFQGFEKNTEGWYGSINRVQSGYSNNGGYADGIASGQGNFHARLSTPSNCSPPFIYNCYGPYTYWGNSVSPTNFPPDGYSTSVDIYLDTAWAASYPDRRFDFASSIHSSNGGFLGLFVFNAGTDPEGGAKFIVGSSTSSYRSKSNPSDPCPSPSSLLNTCRAPVEITVSGWYTFTHTFRDDEGSLAVDMEILDQAGGRVASWTIYSGVPISNAGGPYYIRFMNQEIDDLPIDDSAPTGKATFGFVSKYQKGTNIPTGQTEFQFKAGDLNFHSSSYEWLMVTGSHYAKFKGEGTINGSGNYKFMLWAGDGTGSNGEDTFRIKIWQEDNDTEYVVYDNGMDQAIGGGSIVVHAE